MFSFPNTALLLLMVAWAATFLRFPLYVYAREKVAHLVMHFFACPVATSSTAKSYLLITFFKGKRVLTKEDFMCDAMEPRPFSKGHCINSRLLHFYYYAFQ